MARTHSPAWGQLKTRLQGWKPLNEYFIKGGYSVHNALEGAQRPGGPELLEVDEIFAAPLPDGSLMIVGEVFFQKSGEPSESNGWSTMNHYPLAPVVLGVIAEGAWKEG